MSPIYDNPAKAISAILGFAEVLNLPKVSNHVNPIIDPKTGVAVPGAWEAPVILGTGIGMTMPNMECKISLRSGNQDAWRRWTVNRNDVITAYGLDALMDNQLMPTLEVIGERFPKLSSSERQEALVSSSKQYLSENTKLYFLVKDSVDISGTGVVAIPVAPRVGRTSH